MVLQTYLQRLGEIFLSYHNFYVILRRLNSCRRSSPSADHPTPRNERRSNGSSGRSPERATALQAIADTTGGLKGQPQCEPTQLNPWMEDEGRGSSRQPQKGHQQ